MESVAEEARPRELAAQAELIKLQDELSKRCKSEKEVTVALRTMSEAERTCKLQVCRNTSASTRNDLATSVLLLSPSPFLAPSVPLAKAYTKYDVLEMEIHMQSAIRCWIMRFCVYVINDDAPFNTHLAVLVLVYTEA